MLKTYHHFLIKSVTIFFFILPLENASAFETTKTTDINVFDEKFLAFKEFSFLKEYSDFIKKDGDGFSITVKSGKSVSFKNEPYNGSDWFMKYYLDKYFSEIGYFGISTSYYEGSGYVMVNLVNRLIFSTQSRPIISPNKELLISYEVVEMNGSSYLTVYSVSSEEIKELKSFDLAVNSGFWVDNENFIMKGEYDQKTYLLSYNRENKEWNLAEISKEFVEPEKKPNKELENLKKSYLEIDKIFNKEVALQATSFYPDAVKFIPQQLIDKKIAKISVSSNGLNLKFLPAEMKDDDEIVKIAVSDHGNALEFASERLRNDKDVVIIAIKKDVESFEYASDFLRGTKDIIMVAAESCRDIKDSDRNFFDKQRKCTDLLNNFPEYLSYDKEFLLKLAEALGSRYEFVIDKTYHLGVSDFLSKLPQDLKDDKEFMLEILKLNKSGDIFASCIIKSGISSRLANDKDFAMKAVKIYRNSYLSFDENIKNDEEIFLAFGIIFNAPIAIRNKFKVDKKFFLKFVETYPGNRYHFDRMMNEFFFPKEFINAQDTQELIKNKKFATKHIYED